MKRKLIKSVDACMGRIIVALLKEPAARECVRFDSFLFIRPGGIGDAVLLVPAIKALKNAFPSASVDVLAEKRNAEVFSLCKDVNRVYCYDEQDGLVQALRSNYDVAIDTEQWHRLSAVVACLSRASTIIGFSTNERKKLFTQPVPYSLDEHEIDSFLNLLKPLVPLPCATDTPFLRVTKNLERIALEILGEYAVKRFVSIFPGASISEKQWEIGNFKLLAEMFWQRGIAVAIVGAQNDSMAAETISAGHCLNLAGRTSLAETAAVISKGVTLVSGDSGLLHIAAGLGVPTVSLFGPSNLKKWAPRGDRHLVVSKNPSCSPCSRFGYTPKCPISAKCISDITVDEVFDAVLRLLEKTENLPVGKK